jgi:hypothetical protein
LLCRQSEALPTFGRVSLTSQSWDRRGYLN